MFKNILGNKPWKTDDQNEISIYITKLIDIRSKEIENFKEFLKLMNEFLKFIKNFDSISKGSNTILNYLLSLFVKNKYFSSH